MTDRRNKTLLFVNPQLASELDDSKNGGITADSIFPNSNKKVWWICRRGHSYQSTPNNRNYGKGCPYCSGRKVLSGINDLRTQNPDLAQEWDSIKNFPLKPDSVLPFSNKKVFWKCSLCGHSWSATINSRSNGKGCPRCAKRFHSSFPEQAIYFYLRQTYPDAINSYRDVFKGNQELDIYLPSIKTGIEYDGVYAHPSSKSKKEFEKYRLCVENGIRLIRIREDINNSVSGTYDILLHCTYDSRTYRGLEHTLKELGKYIDIVSDIDIERDRSLIQKQYLSFVKQSSLMEVFPLLAQEWNYEKNNGFTPDMFRHSSGESVWWKCKKCQNEWKAQIYTRSKGIGCPYCANKKVAKGYNDLLTKLPEVAKEWNNQRNTISSNDIVWKSSKKVWWKCSVCNSEWQAKVYHRASGSGCPFCSGRNTIEGVNDISTTHPYLLNEWHPTLNKDKMPKQYKAGSDELIWWKCQKCDNEWQTSIYIRTKGCGCPKCAIALSKEKELQSRIKHAGSFEDWCKTNPDVGDRLLKEWDYTMNSSCTPNSVTYGSKKKVWWKCQLCDYKWEASIQNRKRGNKCPGCHSTKPNHK